MEVEKCPQPSWVSPPREVQRPPRPLDAAISAATAASAPGKRGSGQKQQERTLKEDVSQPTLPSPLGERRQPVLLGTSHQGKTETPQ